MRMGAMVKIRTLMFCCYPGIELAGNLSSVCIENKSIYRTCFELVSSILIFSRLNIRIRARRNNLSERPSYLYTDSLGLTWDCFLLVRTRVLYGVDAGSHPGTK